MARSLRMMSHWYVRNSKISPKTCNNNTFLILATIFFLITVFPQNKRTENYHHMIESYSI